MSEPENIEEVINALKTVPPKRLLIIELANTIPLINGQPDINVLKDKQKELNLAATEAKAYGAATIRAVLALAQMRSISED